MKDTTHSYLMGIITGMMAGAIIFLEIFPTEKLSSESPITPDLEIKVKDGVSDTTYIYCKK